MEIEGELPDHLLQHLLRQTERKRLIAVDRLPDLGFETSDLAVIGAQELGIRDLDIVDFGNRAGTGGAKEIGDPPQREAGDQDAEKKKNGPGAQGTANLA